MPRLATALLAALLLAASGCGGTSAPAEQSGTLVLDFTPNGVHAGLYTMLARDYDGAEGVRMRVRTPPESGGVPLLRSGRADLAVLSITDLALAREQGADLVGVMALVQRPLAAVLARPGVRSPAALEGRRVGVAGLPSDDAVLDSVVRGDGGDPRRVRRVDIGFAATSALLGGRVDAVTAFWNVEGRALRARRPGIREFRVDRFGAPRYPELVLAVTRETLQDRPSLVERSVAAIRRGYEETLRDPDAGVLAMTDRVRSLERETVVDQLGAVSPAFVPGGRRPIGALDRGVLEAWARWAERFGIVERPPELDLMFDPGAANAGDPPG